MKSTYNGKTGADIAKRNKGRPKGPTHEAKLRAMGKFDLHALRADGWFRLEVK